MQRLFRILQQADMGLLLSDEQLETAQDQESLFLDEELADLFWLADKLNYTEAQTEVDAKTSLTQDTTTIVTEDSSQPAAPASPTVPLALDRTQQDQEQTTEEEPEPSKGLPIEVQAASALPNRRDLGRALRPLMKKVPSLSCKELDITATVNQIAKEDLWWPVMRPAKERWFDLELVVDDSPGAALWQPLVDEFRLLLERQGAFRNVRTWRMGSDRSNQLYLKVRAQGSETARSRRPGELIGVSGRRLVLVVSDCCGSLWQQGLVHDWLMEWSQAGPTTVLQLMPERLWSQSELDVGHRVQVSNVLAGAPNTKLRFHGYRQRKLPVQEQRLLMPLTMMTPVSLQQWSNVIAAVGQQQAPARLFDLAWVQNPRRQQRARYQGPTSCEEKVALFYARASEEAQQLAEAMALFPVSLDVVYLLQAEVLPVRIQPVHVAEVYRSGLLQPQARGSVRQATEYDFDQDIRDLVYRRLSADEIFSLWNQMSAAVGRILGQPGIKSFSALLFPDSELSQYDRQTLLPFAKVMTTVLHRLGGDYATLARMADAKAEEAQHELNPGEVSPELPIDWKPLEVEIAQLVEVDETNFWPSLQTETITIAIVTFVDDGNTGLERFEFTTATISKQQQRQGFLSGLFNRQQQQAQWVIKKRQGVADRFVEQLPQEVSLDMVAIPAGSFAMGSPGDEPERFDNEEPQHEVTFPAFFMGRYPVTQAQWRAVAALEPVEQALDLAPSGVKGDDRPVEQVTWFDAVEFCARLKRHTGRSYRLPSEAEWEYACRAGTTTPFHFGEMITTDLANYDGSAYADGPKGQDRRETTEVGEFPSNAWGVSDMHGNVWEWCQDHYHNSYQGAPKDGTAWVDENPKEELRILRGGSWIDRPGYGRSACRVRNEPSIRYSTGGFRVVCVAPRT